MFQNTLLILLSLVFSALATWQLLTGRKHADRIMQNLFILFLLPFLYWAWNRQLHIQPVAACLAAFFAIGVPLCLDIAMDIKRAQRKGANPRRARAADPQRVATMQQPAQSQSNDDDFFLREIRVDPAHQ